jgi:hypothetical protein
MSLSFLENVTVLQLLNLIIIVPKRNWNKTENRLYLFSIIVILKIMIDRYKMLLKRVLYYLCTALCCVVRLR